MTLTARITGKSLYTTLSTGNICAVAHATQRFDGTFYWHGLGRAGRKGFASRREALEAAGKALGFRVQPEASPEATALADALYRLMGRITFDAPALQNSKEFRDAVEVLNRTTDPAPFTTN